MANWKNNNNNPEKDLSSIGAMFETNKIKKIYDISELYPTKIIKLLGINSEWYSVKLADPEKFAVSEILRLAYILNIDPKSDHQCDTGRNRKEDNQQDWGDKAKHTK
jgi:hypothetical protein